MTAAGAATGSATHPVGPAPRRVLDATRADQVAVALLVAVVVSPIVVAAVMAGAEGFTPFGDNGVIAVRSADVLTGDSPLLGMPSATQGWVGIATAHPGPSVFWAYAPFVLALGPAAGLLAGAAAVAGASVAGVVWVGFRRGGLAVAGLAAMAAFAAWLGAGGPNLHEPLNAFAALLPYLLFLLAGWAVLCGDRALWPLSAVVGTFAVQADLAYLVLVAVPAVAVLVARRRDLLDRLRPPRRHDGRAGTAVPLVVTATVVGLGAGALAGAAAGVDSVAPALAGAAAAGLGACWGAPAARTWALDRERRPEVLGLLVLALLWAPPVVEALDHRGGNVVALLDVAGAGVATEGWGFAAAALLEVVRAPVGLFGDGLAADGWEGSWGPAALAVVAGVALMGRVAARRRDDAGRGVLLAGSVVVAAMTSAAAIPLTLGYNPLHLLWLAPVAAFTWFAVAVAAVRWAPGGSARAGIGLLVALALVPLASGLQATQWPIAGSSWERWQHAVTGPLGADTAEDLEDGGTYLLGATGGIHLRALENGLFARLEEAGVSVRTDELVAYFGRGREAAASGRGLDGLVWVTPADLPHPPPGAHRVATHRPDGWDPAAARALAEDVVEWLGSTPLVPAPDAAISLRTAAYGHLPDVCPLELRAAPPCEDFRGSSLTRDARGLPPMAILDLYRGEAVAAPALPDDLADRLRAVHGAQAVDVWLGPVVEDG